MTYSTTPITSGSAKFSTIDPDAPLFIQEQDITRGVDHDSAITLYDNAKNTFDAFASKSTPAGTILIYGGATAPEGFLMCNGQAVSRSDYDVLFQIIGTTFGTGDGTTTFNVPDLRTKFIVGSGNGYSLGSTGGAASVTLTTQEIPAHTHTVNMTNGASGGSTVPAHNTGSGVTTFGSGSTGGGQAHENRPPYLTVNFIIKT